VVMVRERHPGEVMKGLPFGERTRRCVGEGKSRLGWSPLDSGTVSTEKEKGRGPGAAGCIIKLAERTA
jgi:hypothetical protein